MKKLLLTILILAAGVSAVNAADVTANTPTATPTDTPVPVQYVLNSVSAIPTVVVNGKTAVYFEAKDLESLQPIL